MRYINGIQFDPRYQIDTHRTYEQILNRHRVLLSSMGTPITVFYTEGATQTIINGKQIRQQPCYCALDHEGRRKDPDRYHQLCYGTGVLPGYDRYGYKTHIIATTSENLTLTGVQKNRDSKGRVSVFNLSGNNMSGTIETSDYELEDFIEFTHLRFVERVNLEENRNRYEYSTDMGITWNPITIDYTDSVNPVVTTVFPTTMERIRFRITQEKRFANSSSPRFMYIKFRYRNQYNLSEIDCRFKEINLPAGLASYTIAPFSLEQQKPGLTVSQNPTWWTLPYLQLTEGDIIMYLLGHHAGQMYFVENLQERVYGKFGYPTSISFETKLIQDDKSSMGITKFLAEQDELLLFPTFSHFDIANYFPTERELSDSHYPTDQPG